MNHINIEDKIFEWVKAGYKYVYIEPSVDDRVNRTESNITYYPGMKFYKDKKLYLKLDDVRKAFKDFDIDYMNISYEELKDTIVTSWENWE